MLSLGKVSPIKPLLACVFASGLALSAVHASQQHVRTVFYILLENRNFTSGTSLAAYDTSGGSVVDGNSAAPYINSLISGTNDTQVSYCTCYHNDLATPNGSNPSIHPSEPNYVWGEAGSNLSKLDDNDPYGSGQSIAQILSYLQANPSVCTQHLTGLMQAAGITWKSYQEGIDHQNTTGGNANLGGSLTNTVLTSSSWTVPLASFSGSNSAYTNPYNGSHQWNFACKHDGSLFFLDTNGSTPTAGVTGTNNAEISHYAPLEQLATDLANNTVAQYNVITPDLYNDMHTALNGGFTYHSTHYTGDLAQVAQGDNFLSILVPQIMASQAYQNNGAIVIWTDETEGTNQNDFNHTLTEIVISPLAKGSGYASSVNFTHSSDIATMQEIFGLVANTSATGYLNDAGNVSNSTGAFANTPGFGTSTALDLSDLFQSGVIPSGIPTLVFNPAGLVVNGRAHTVTQSISVTNTLNTAVSNPVYLVLGNLNTTLSNQTGLTQNTAPVGSPYITVASGLAAGASATVSLKFTQPGTGTVTYIPSVISTSGQP